MLLAVKPLLFCDLTLQLAVRMVADTVLMLAVIADHLGKVCQQ